MLKYQFFCRPHSERKEFTYLLMGSDTFISEKEQLMKQGYEVEDDAIYAESTEQAIEKFKSNYIYLIEEYNNSNVIGGAATFIIESYKEVVRRLAARQQR